MAVPIIFNAIIVNGQNTNSTISIGENQQDGWSVNGKSNFGIGTLYGLNNILNTLNIINDNDILDNPICDADIIPSAQAQAL